MPRIVRIIVPNLPYHVTQRGNYGENIFEDDMDRSVYLYWLREYGQRYGTKFWAYCLMTNHVHYITVPENEKSLALTFNKSICDTPSTLIEIIIGEVIYGKEDFTCVCWTMTTNLEFKSNCNLEFGIYLLFGHCLLLFILITFNS